MAETPPFEALEERLLDVLTRISTASVNMDEALEMNRLLRRTAQQRKAAMLQLQEMVSNLDEIARRLRALPAVRYDDGEGQAREDIAVDFSSGARALEAAKASLERATKDLEYLDYISL